LGIRIAWAFSADVSASTVRELAASRRFAANGLCDLIEAGAEDIVKQKGGAIQWGKAFQSQHQRQRDVVRIVLRSVQHGVRKPRADIGFVPVLRRPQPVEKIIAHPFAPQC
jgi:hypothetical protein